MLHETPDDFQCIQQSVRSYLAESLLRLVYLESMTSMGCTVFQRIRFGILPQLFALFLSVVIYRFDMNMREASVLGLVGAGGIGAPLIFAMQGYK